MKTLTLDYLERILKDNTVAIRRSARLQPAGGAGDKIFPPTYEGGQYALEDRIIDGQPKHCVLLDSVQSQANRMELSLLEAHRSKDINLPLVEVDFATAGLPEVGMITSLDAPHRLADAILRDSLNNGVKFRSSAEGKILDTATLANATGIFGICPTALLFGLWDSAGPRGGMGTKFQRVLVSELFGVEIVPGVRPSSRLDPLGIVLNAGPIYATSDGGWTTNGSDAIQEKGKPKLVGKDGKPSEINHGNVTPSTKGNHGGVTISHALQVTVISIAALRRLRFPLDGTTNLDVDRAARVVLTALGLCAATLSIEQGCDLRSRCLLVPDPGYPAAWELVRGDGNSEAFTLSATDACTLLKDAVAAATALGLPWCKESLILTPSEGLAALVRKSRDLSMQVSAEGN